MRRNDKEILDQELLEKILHTEPVCRIALSDGGCPYLVPMIFAHQDNFLFLHSAKEGKKINILKENNRICFEVESNVEIVPAENACNWTIKYYCIIGFGQACFVDNIDEKKTIMNLMMDKYSGRKNWEFPKEALEKTAIIKIRIDEMTGKKSKL
jgi:Predicted flavin-nucleotide-binding protein